MSLVYLTDLISTKADNTILINGKPLTSDIEINKNDIKLDKVDNTSDLDKPISLLTKKELDTKIDKKDLLSNIILLKPNINLNHVDNTSDLNKPVSLLQEIELNKKQSINEKNKPNGYAGLDSNGKIDNSQINFLSPLTFKGTWNALLNIPIIESNIGNIGDFYKVSVAGTTNINNLNNWNIGDWIIYTGNQWDIIDNSETINSVAGRTGHIILNKTDINLDQVDNTSDLNKPVSLLQQQELNLKVDKIIKINNKDLSSDINLTKADIGLDEVDNTSDINKPVSLLQQQLFDTKVDKTIKINNKDLSSDINLTKADIDLDQVDNTSDLNKPVSLLQQQLFDTKVDKTIKINNKDLSLDINLTKTDIGLDEVDNTSDLNKPVSLLQQQLFDTKVDKTIKINNKDLSSDINLTKTDIGLDEVDNTSDLNKPVSLLQQQAFDTKVDKTIKINNKDLSLDINLTKADIDLDQVDNTSDLNKPISLLQQQLFDTKVDKTIKINNKDLSLDINLTKADIDLDQVDNTSDLNKPVSLLQQQLFDTKIDKTIKINNKDLSLDINLTKTDIGLDEVDNTSDLNKPVSLLQQQLFDTKVDKTIKINNKDLSLDINLTKTDIGLDQVDNTSDLNKPISNDTLNALNLKVDKTIKINNKDLTSNINLTKVDIGLDNIDNTADLNKPISLLQQQLFDTKVDKTIKINNKDLSSDINLTKTDIGLDNIDNTSDINKPVSLLQQQLFDTKVDKTIKINNKDLSLDINLTKTDIGLDNIDNTSDLNKPVSLLQQQELNLKVDKTIKINNKDLTSNINLTKTDIDLDQVDNTSDLNKPVSLLQQQLFDTKVDKTIKINNKDLTSDINLTKADIGLDNIDNTSDINKPVSLLQQQALNLKLDKTNFDSISSQINYNDSDLLSYYYSNESYNFYENLDLINFTLINTESELINAITNKIEFLKLNTNITLTSTLNLNQNSNFFLYLNNYKIISSIAVTMITTTLNNSSVYFIGPGIFEHTKTTNTTIETIFSISNNGTNLFRILNCTIRVMEFGIILNQGALQIDKCTFEYIGAINNSHRYIHIKNVLNNSYIDNCTFSCQPKNGTTFYTNFILFQPTSWTSKCILHVRNNKQTNIGDLRQFFIGDSIGVNVQNAQLLFEKNDWNDNSGGIFFLGSNTFDSFYRIILINNKQGSAATGNFKGMFFVDASGGNLGTKCEFLYYNNISLAGNLRSDFRSISNGSNIIAVSTTTQTTFNLIEITKEQKSFLYSKIFKQTSNLNKTFDNYQNLNQKNISNGYVGLDSNTKISLTQIPDLYLNYLKDINFNNLINNNTLIYDSTNNKWNNSIIKSEIIDYSTASNIKLSNVKISNGYTGSGILEIFLPAPNNNTRLGYIGYSTDCLNISCELQPIKFFTTSSNDNNLIERVSINKSGSMTVGSLNNGIIYIGRFNETLSSSMFIGCDIPGISQKFSLSCVQGPGNWFGDAVTGDVALRCANGRLLLGNNATLSTLILNNKDVYIGNGQNAVNLIIGRWAINITDNTNFHFLKDGNLISFIAYNGSYNQVSDKNLKTNIKQIDNGINIINKLNPVSFNFNNDLNKINYGLIAQEVEEIIPEIVNENVYNINSDKKIKSINYTELIPFLIKSIQELNLEIINLKNIINQRL